MEFLGALSDCWWLGKECVPKWEAWAVYAAISAALGTWVVGIFAGFIAWMAYTQRERERKAFSDQELSKSRSLYKRWVADIRTCSVANTFVKSHGPTVLSSLESGSQLHLRDLLDTLNDILLETIDEPTGVDFSSEDLNLLTNFKVAHRRARSAVAGCREYLKEGRPNADVAEKFRILAMWVGDIEIQVMKLSDLLKRNEPGQIKAG